MNIISGVLRSTVVLPALSILGALPTRGVPIVYAAPERLVAEAPIWGADQGKRGYAFLPVTIHGHAVTIVIDLNNEGDLSLSPAALENLGVLLPDTTTQLDAISIGTDVQHDIPLHVIQKLTWAVSGPPNLPLVVGIVGVHFLTTHYDLLYDFPGRRVRLYAFPKATENPSAWLPPGIKPGDCSPLIPIPPGAATFTGMEVQLDGHKVTGVIEMAPYGTDTHGDEKMNQGALDALGLPAQSPRLQPVPNRQPFRWHGRLVKDQVVDVHIAVGKHTFWTGPVQVYPILDVEAGLPPNTPVMLLNLTTIHHVVLYNSVSSGQVCLSTP